MTNLLNVFTIAVTFAYALAFLNNAYTVIRNHQKPEDRVESSDDKDLVELQNLFAAVAEKTYSPEQKPSFDGFTKDRMKAYIADNDLTEKIEAWMGIKLYRAKKTEILSALAAV